MSSANIFFLHGDDPAGITERINILCASLGDASMADLNLTTLDGRVCDENEIRNAALSMPFLANHRLVIVHSALSRLGQDSQKKRFAALLDEIPSTTQLVLVIPDEPAWLKDASGRWERGWKVLSASHFLMKWAKENPSKISNKNFHLPKQKDIPG